jgi:hypothetical protein
MWTHAAQYRVSLLAMVMEISSMMRKLCIMIVLGHKAAVSYRLPVGISMAYGTHSVMKEED